MKYIFEVTMKTGYSGDTEKEVNVYAASAEAACADALRHASRSYWSNAEVAMVRRIVKVDVDYKTPRKKKR